MSQPKNQPESFQIQQIATRIVYTNKWMTLREDTILRPDGSQGIYSFVEKPDFALIIPLEYDGFHLVEQYRYPVKKRYWEFPQGTFSGNTNDDPVKLAHTELIEETGLQAGQLKLLGHLYTGYGSSSQGFHVFLATELKANTPKREPEEQDMQQTWMPRTEFERLIRAGIIIDSPSLAAYSLFMLHTHTTANL